MTPTPAPSGPEPRADDPDTRSADFEVAPDKASVAWARHRLRGQLTRWGIEATACEEPVLVLSELVTNALLHSRSRTIRCRLELTDSLLYLAVTDQGGTAGNPPALEQDADNEEGRGLHLVSTLAETWGHTRENQGLRVWALLPIGRPGLGPRSAPALGAGPLVAGLGGSARSLDLAQDARPRVDPLAGSA